MRIFLIIKKINNLKLSRFQRESKHNLNSQIRKYIKKGKPDRAEVHLLSPKIWKNYQNNVLIKVKIPFKS